MSSNYNWRLSGGATNTDPDLSLGGVKSSEPVLQQTATWVGGGFTDLTLLGASGNPAGIGTLKAGDPSGGLAWFPLGDPRDPVPAGGNVYGTVINQISEIPIGDDILSGLISTITVRPETGYSNPDYGELEEVLISDTVGELFPSVTESEAETGLTRYRLTYIENNDASPKFIAFWIGQNSSGSDIFEVGIEAADGVAQTITNETTAPTGITFTRSVALSPELQIELAASSYRGIWIKQIIPALSSVPATPSTFALAFLD